MILRKINAHELPNFTIGSWNIKFEDRSSYDLRKEGLTCFLIDANLKQIIEKIIAVFRLSVWWVVIWIVVKKTNR